MRRLLLCLLCIIVLSSISIKALAESCPLPDVNTDAEIFFNGFEWYTDYNTTLKTAESKGYSNDWDWSRDSFEEDSCVTPHWHTVYNSINGFAGSETGCGGSMSFYSDLPTVAGYRLDEVHLYFMWNPDVGRVSDYKNKDAVQFYMGKYEFDVGDKEAAYKDLCSKLSGLYGENPYEGRYGISPTYYRVWVNEDGACVALSYDEYGVTLVYMAPGAEEKLCKVEELVKANEIASAAGDVSGL